MAKVLIVDDQPEIRRLLSIALGREHEVIEAGNGTTALAQVRLHAPEVLLLDVMMPGEIGGMQVLQQIKGDPATLGIRVAMLTARGQIADREAAREAGADAYFTKPFSPLAVLNWIRNRGENAPPPSGT